MSYKEDVGLEFYRLAEIMVNQGDVDVLVDLVDYKTQEAFVKEWHDNDELDQ